MNTSRHNPRQVVITLFVLTMAALVVGLVGFWPVLEAGHRRMPPWKIPIYWTADLVALAWFVRFSVVHGFAGRPLEDRPAGQCPGERPWWRPALHMLLAVGVEVGFTAYEVHEEFEARQNARVTSGEIYDYLRKKYPGQKGSHPGGTTFTVRYRYQDEQGRWHEGGCYTGWSDDGKFHDRLPKEVTDGLAAGKKPLPLRVYYDPDWPARSWATDGCRLFDYGQLFLISGAFLIAQLTFLPACVAAYVQSAWRGILPWWHELVQAVPLMLEAVVLLLLAVIRLVDS
jgi:hypothetical protein